MEKFNFIDMNKVLKILAFLVISINLNAQTPSPTKARYLGAWFLSIDTASATGADSLNLRVNRADSSLRYRHNIASVWRKVQFAPLSGDFLLSSNNLADVTNINTARANLGVLAISDTSAMLANYRRKTTLIENSDLRYSTISGISLGANLSQLQWGYGFSNTTSYDGSASILQKVDTSEISTKANVTALLLGKQPLLGYTPENIANKGAANGYAPIGADSKIATTYLPAITMNNVYTSSSQAAMLALSAVVGDLCLRTDSSITYVLQTAAPSNPASWKILLTPAAPVLSVNGKTGVVSLLTSDISEGGTNYYWTAARSRAAQSVSAVGLTYNNTTGDISITAGYVIPTTTDISNGNTAYSKRVTAVALSSSTLTITFADASTVTAAVPTFNQNTSGNAATATLASNTTQWNGYTNNFTVTQTSGVTSITGFDGSNVVRAYSAAAVSAFIGLNTTNWVPYSGATTTLNLGTQSLYMPSGTLAVQTIDTYSGTLITFNQNVTLGSKSFTAGSGAFGGTVTIGGGSGNTLSSGSLDLSKDIGIVATQGIVSGSSRVLSFQDTYQVKVNGTFGTTGAATFAGQTSVNTTNPLSWMFGVGANSGNGIRLYSGTATSNATWDVYTDATYGSIMRLYATDGTTANITMRGDGLATFASSVTATAFYESSDIRQKKVHKTFASADGINAIQYTFKPSGDLKMGYSAQQVRTVLPYAVHEDSEGWLKVDYTSVHTYKIMLLEKRIAELEKLIK